MRLVVDASSAVPPFEQVRTGVIELVRSGELAAGARLPTVRALAEQLDLAPNTVARAYRDLERDEVIETRGRSGSFIAATGDPTERKAQLAAREFVDRTRALGIADAAALSLVEAALKS